MSFYFTLKDRPVFFGGGRGHGISIPGGRQMERQQEMQRYQEALREHVRHEAQNEAELEKLWQEETEKVRRGPCDAAHPTSLVLVPRGGYLLRRRQRCIFFKK